jgi:hypothetical protein
VRRVCSNCEEEFELRPGKPGLIHLCEACSGPDEPRVGGFMHWAHKTAPELEITTMSKAKDLWAKTKRFGPGVTCCLTQSKVTAHKQLINAGIFDKDRDDEGTDKERKLA